jgi:hypothetical protein
MVLTQWFITHLSNLYGSQQPASTLIRATQSYPAFSYGLVPFTLRALTSKNGKLCKVHNLVFDQYNFGVANLQGRA